MVPNRYFAASILSGHGYDTIFSIMALFLCKVGTSDGRVTVRYCRARNRFELRESLEEEGFCVFSIRRALFSLNFLSQRRVRRWSFKRFLLFNQELLVLLRSGMPILEILDALMHEKDPAAVKTVLREIREAVKGGSSLSEAFSSFPEFFPRLYVASVASGEKTGDLPQTVSRYLDYQKRFAKVRGQLKSAAIYPLVLLATTFAVLLFMFFFVIPNFVQIFADAKVPLPFLTRLVLGAADFAQRGWWVVLLAGCLMIWLLGRYVKTPDGRRLLDKSALNIPLLGDLFRLSGLVNFSRTTATILSSGLPLVEGMNLACGVLNNLVLQQGIHNVVHSVNEGDSLANALQRNRIFPVVAVRMIATGERTGALSRMFEEVAEYYEGEIDQRLERLAALAEPMILLFVGLVIGGIVVALYLPIFQMASTAGSA